MSRDPRLDNAKFVMIFFVVLGHAIEPFVVSNELLRWAYMCIYMVHMPAFIFLAGVLSRSKRRPGDLLKMFNGLIVPWFILSLIYESAHFVLFGQMSHYLMMCQSYWILWFLPCLFVWRFLLPYLRDIPCVISVSTVIALFPGCTNFVPLPLDLSRLIFFLPFFLMGNLIGKELLQMVSSLGSSRWLGAVPLVVCAVLVWVFLDQPIQLLYGTVSYNDMGLSIRECLIARIVLFAASSFSVISVMALIPGERLLFGAGTKLTMPVYLWHGLIIKLVLAVGVFHAMTSLSSGVLLCLMAIGSLAITLLLANPKIDKFTQRMTGWAALTTKSQPLVQAKAGSVRG